MRHVLCTEAIEAVLEVCGKDVVNFGRVLLVVGTDGRWLDTSSANGNKLVCGPVSVLLLVKNDHCESALTEATENAAQEVQQRRGRRVFAKEV